MTRIFCHGKGLGGFMNNTMCNYVFHLSSENVKLIACSC